MKEDSPKEFMAGGGYHDFVCTIHGKDCDVTVAELLAAAQLKASQELVRETLERLKQHREFIHWGDGSPSDLDAYLDAELNKLGEKQ